MRYFTWKLVLVSNILWLTEDTLPKENLAIEEEVVIERAHIMKIDKNKKGNTPRTIVSRILNYKDKVKIPRNAKKR